MAIGFPVKANYVTGEVLTATNMNDLSGSVNLLQSTGYAAGKNALLNSAFQVWQRGTSVANTSSGTRYAADQWQLSNSSGTGGQDTMSQQLTSDTTNLPFIQYCARVQRNSGVTNGAFIFIAQNLENINSAEYIGQTVTLSFYVRKGADFSAASNLLTANLYSGTGTDQNFANVAITGQATVATTSPTLTSTWQRVTVSGTVATSAKQLIVVMQYTPTGTAGTNDYFEVTGVQLEVGASVTAFQTATGTIQAELAACQRYYFRSGLDASGAYGVLGNSGYTSSTTVSNVLFNLPVHMRVTPTAIDYPTLSTTRILNIGAPFTPTAASLTAITSTADIAWVEFTSSGMTASQFSQYTKNNSATAYIGFSAEL